MPVGWIPEKMVWGLSVSWVWFDEVGDGGVDVDVDVDGDEDEDEKCDVCVWDAVCVDRKRERRGCWSRRVCRVGANILMGEVNFTQD